MNKFRYLFLGFLVAAGWSCDDDGSRNVFPPDIEDLPFQVSIDNLDTYSVTINLVARGRLDSLAIEKNDVEVIAGVKLEGDKEMPYDFSYTATSEDSDSHVVFDFSLIDRDGRTIVEQLILSVGDAPTAN